MYWNAQPKESSASRTAARGDARPPGSGSVDRFRLRERRSPRERERTNGVRNHKSGLRDRGRPRMPRRKSVNLSKLQAMEASELIWGVADPAPGGIVSSRSGNGSAAMNVLERSAERIIGFADRGARGRAPSRVRERRSFSTTRTTVTTRTRTN
jgi:hypothetical protein